VQSFLASMPDRYLLSNTPATIAEHFEADGRLKGPLAMDVKHYRKKAYSRLIITTLDAPGLFSNLCGVLAAYRINILGAQVYTRKGGEVLDIFHVNSPAGEVVADQAKWDKVKSDLLDVIQGIKRVEDVMKRVGPSILENKYRPGVKPHVHIDNDTSDNNTIIEIFAQDRVGLLYKISKVLVSLGLYIDVSKISTMGERVTDVFYVKDIFGQKIYYKKKLAEIKEAILEVVG